LTSEVIICIFLSVTPFNTGFSAMISNTNILSMVSNLLVAVVLVVLVVVVCPPGSVAL
jgi:uncharacterized membrane protein